MKERGNCVARPTAATAPLLNDSRLAFNRLIRSHLRSCVASPTSSAFRPHCTCTSARASFRRCPAQAGGPVRPAAAGFGLVRAGGHALAAPRRTAGVRHAGLDRPAVHGPVLVAAGADGAARRPAAAGLDREPGRPAGLPLESLRTPHAAAVPLLALVVTFIGFLNARRTARVVTVEVPLAGLPAALHGFTHRADQRHPRRPDHPARATWRRIVEARQPAQARPGGDHRRPGRRLRAGAGRARRAAAPGWVAGTAATSSPATTSTTRAWSLAGRAAAAGHPACCTTSTW